MTKSNDAVPDMLERQLACATDPNAVFCIGCGQPDEPHLHDRARCPGSGGELDKMPVATALEIFDRSCELLPDLEDHARALHCAIVAGAALASAPAGDGVERCDVTGGLLIDSDDWTPVSVIAASLVYVRQGARQITMDREMAAKMVASLSLALRTPAAETADALASRQAQP